MMSPLFESLVVNNLTILTDEPDDSTAMLWNESELNEKQVTAFREWSNFDNEVTGESNGMGYLKYKY